MSGISISGAPAAKLDDAANYLPARMAALLLAGAAALTGQNARARCASGGGTGAAMPAPIPPRRRR